jgi:anti-anti-sigma factor
MLEHQPYAFSLGLTGAYCVVRAEGELDVAAVAQMRSAVYAARRHAAHVVVDLRDVSFLDGSALHALAQLQGDRSGRPSFHCVPGDAVQRVLDVAGARAALRWISPEQIRG